jgi:hypothetical protein
MYARRRYARGERRPRHAHVPLPPPSSKRLVFSLAPTTGLLPASIHAPCGTCGLHPLRANTLGPLGGPCSLRSTHSKNPRFPTKVNETDITPYWLYWVDVRHVLAGAAELRNPAVRQRQTGGLSGRGGAAEAGRAMCRGTGAGRCPVGGHRRGYGAGRRGLRPCRPRRGTSPATPVGRGYDTGRAGGGGAKSAAAAGPREAGISVHLPGDVRLVRAMRLGPGDAAGFAAMRLGRPAGSDEGASARASPSGARSARRACGGTDAGLRGSGGLRGLGLRGSGWLRGLGLRGSGWLRGAERAVRAPACPVGHRESGPVPARHGTAAYGSQEAAVNAASRAERRDGARWVRDEQQRPGGLRYRTQRRHFMGARTAPAALRRARRRPGGAAATDPPPSPAGRPRPEPRASVSQRRSGVAHPDRPATACSAAAGIPEV